MRTNMKIECRAQLGDLCNELGFKLAVEVGVHQGVFADQFLSRFNGKLICVDDYKIPGEFTPAFVPHSPSRGFDRRVAEIVLTGKHGSRAEFRIMSSQEAADEFFANNIRPDFVYIDGAHDLPTVQADIQRWYTILNPGGIIAGHDYEPKDPNLCGVAAVVNYFAVQKALDLKLTYDEPASWYMRKPV